MLSANSLFSRFKKRRAKFFADQNIKLVGCLLFVDRNVVTLFVVGLRCI